MKHKTTPETGAQDVAGKSLLDRTKDALADARDTVSGGVSSALDAARKHPATTAAVAAGAAAAVAGAAYGISKLRGKDDTR